MCKEDKNENTTTVTGRELTIPNPGFNYFLLKQMKKKKNKSKPKTKQNKIQGGSEIR